MYKKKPLIKEIDNKENRFLAFNQEKLSIKNPLVSKTLNIYANALSSCLCISSARTFPCVNLPSRLLNLEGFSWQKGYRNPLASVSYTQTYKKFLEALRLVALTRKKDGRIYIIFDGDQYRPAFSFLEKKGYSKKKESKVFAFPLKKPQYQGFQGPLEQGAKYTNTTELTQSLLENRAEINNINWSSDNWVAGTFSNFKQVSKSISLYKTLSRQFLEILENQTSKASPRYFLMGKKFQGNLFFSKKKLGTFLDFLREDKDQKSQRVRFCLTNQGSWQFLPSSSITRVCPKDFLVAYKDFQAPSDRNQIFTNKEDFVLSSKHQKKSVTSLSHGMITKHNSNYRKKNDSSKSKKEPILKKKNCLGYKNLPDLIVIENAEKYRNVIAEAETLKIPVIAFVESDILSNISIALPLNALKHYFLAILLFIIHKVPRY